MDYDLLIKHGRVVDGSGLPSYIADVGIKAGKIVGIGRLNGSAARTIDATSRLTFLDEPVRCAFTPSIVQRIRLAVRRIEAVG